MVDRRRQAFRPLPDEAPRALEAEARQVDAEIQAIVRRGRLADCELAYKLARVAERRLYVPLGYSSAAAYAVDNDYTESAGHARDLIKLTRELERLPETKAWFQAGKLFWTKARLIASIAEPEDEREWLARSHLPYEELDRLRKLARGEAPTKRVTLEFDLADWALVEAVTDAHLKAARDEGAPITRAQAFARAVKAGGGGVERRVVLKLCPGCDQAAMETRDGTVPVSRASAEAAGCDGEVLDVTGEPKPATRAVPRKVRDFVLARADHRCEVPGCRNRDDLQVHHEGGWKQGHDPSKLHAYCFAHHDARHEELLGMTGTRATGVTYTTPSGQDITAQARSRARGVAIADATKALRNLQLGARAARELVAAAERALEARHAAPTVEALVHEALVLLPPAGAGG